MFKTQNGLTATFNCPIGGWHECCFSPILFSFFLNDLNSFVSTDSYGIDLDLCKIFPLVFADDLVMFAESKIELQRLLNKLCACCTECSLKNNLDKTSHVFLKWWISSEVWKMVLWWYSVKHCYILQIFRLGYFFKIIMVYVSKKVGRTGVKSNFWMKANLSKFGTLSVNLLLKIFYTKIIPILTYGADIWFPHSALDIERIKHNFCKYILQVPKNSPNIFARGELGRGSIYTVRCINLIKYRLRILDMNANRYPNICYKLQSKWLNVNYRTNC